MSEYIFTIDDATGHVVTAGMRYGRKPTFIKADSDHLVLHVTGGLEYIDGGGNKYVPARFLFLQIHKRETLPDQKRTLTVYVCSLIFEVPGIPKRPKGGAI